jgi:hypothetical protein
MAVRYVRSTSHINWIQFICTKFKNMLLLWLRRLWAVCKGLVTSVECVGCVDMYFLLHRMLPRCANSTLSVILRDSTSLLWPSLQLEAVCCLCLGLNVIASITISDYIMQSASVTLLTVLPMFIIIYSLRQPFSYGCRCIISFKPKKVKSLAFNFAFTSVI